MRATESYCLGMRKAMMALRTKAVIVTRASRRRWFQSRVAFVTQLVCGAGTVDDGVALFVSGIRLSSLNAGRKVEWWQSCYERVLRRMLR